MAGYSFETERLLYKLGACENNIAELLDYTANVFAPCEDTAGDDYLERWTPVLETAAEHGAAAAVNRHLVKDTLRMDFTEPESLRIELFNSIGGTIPVITAGNVRDFEQMVRNIVYKGKDVQNITEMGASFAFGKSNRFILLSNKPYSNVPAEIMGLDETVWRERSMIIRRNHESAHYYTKRFWGSSRNNLRDELIADFCGIYAAFGEYKAEWFLKFLGLSDNSDGTRGRIKIYTQNLSVPAAEVIKKLAFLAAERIERWSKTSEFMLMDERERICYLCGKDLLWG
jgi:hypothetical protein